ncbi:MAG: biopolymer transporter ExbD [Planctomycetes bacterium]|nr:biopolymer transporter ExbD [Planctomycetota bacterium]
MSRAMIELQFREKAVSAPSINITPLVDVLFMLLLFFVVSSTFLEQPNLKLELPRTTHAKPSRLDELVLVVTRDGSLFLQGEAVGMPQLAESLRARLVGRESKSLVLRADKGVEYGLVITVMDTAKGVGFEKIIASTVSEETASRP